MLKMLTINELEFDARDGKTMARLSVEISHFSSKRTNGTQEDNVRTCSPPAGAAAGRKRRNRGPKSAARSRTRATKHRAVVSAARKSKSETLLTGDARDADDIPATQENPSTNEAARCVTERRSWEGGGVGCDH